VRPLKIAVKLGLAVLFFFSVLTFASVLTSEELLPPRQTDYIIVVSGPGAETQQRTAKGIELYNTVEVTRGLILAGGTGAAEDMRTQALRAGVADPAIQIENRSRSTLQNALFVRDLGIDPNSRILLVTHQYHAIRTQMSFYWAGFTTVNLHTVDAGEPLIVTKPMLMETIKWPANILRAAFGSAMMALDVPRDSWIEWLN